MFYNNRLTTRRVFPETASRVATVLHVSCPTGLTYPELLLRSGDPCARVSHGHISHRKTFPVGGLRAPPPHRRPCRTPARRRDR